MVGGRVGGMGSVHSFGRKGLGGGSRGGGGKGGGGEGGGGKGGGGEGGGFGQIGRVMFE